MDNVLSINMETWEDSVIEVLITHKDRPYQLWLDAQIIADIIQTLKEHLDDLTESNS